VVDRIKEIYPIVYGKKNLPKSKVIGKEFARGIIVEMVKGKKVNWARFGYETNINQRFKWLSLMEKCIEKKAILLGKIIIEVEIEEGVKDLMKREWKVTTTTKCVLVHFGFHYILSEFGHFYLVKLFNPLMNEDQLLRTMNCFTST